ncbi:IclR family transcriptional regulator [Kribbella qitaiheensis]|uniref:IclR family transcriptional regulator n=1 Tax=Kribbella qitaiheensis TaxID=1544730 RepID=UPI003623B15D
MTQPAQGVQTVTRALELLDRIADHGEPVTVSSLATESGLPLPTAHRLLKTLVALGYVRQLPSRRYSLGPRLIRLGEHAGRALGAAAHPFLTRLVDSTGETANLAMRESDMVVYVAQVPSRHAMRMFTEIGRRVLPHCTGVGKAMLSQLPDDEVKSLVQRTGMPALTDRTITDLGALLADLELIRARGWAEDNGEQEIGVRCLAVPVLGTGIAAALSVSGPEARITPEAGRRIGPALIEIAAEFAESVNTIEA